MGGAMFGDGWVQLLARGAVGVLLLAAGIAKLRQERWPQEAVDQLGLVGLPGAVVGAFLLPWIEYGVGGLLLLGLETRWAAVAAASLMAGFAALLLLAMRQRRAVRLRCAPGLGCRADGWTVCRNLLLAGVALVPAVGGPDVLTLDHRLYGVPAAALVPWNVVPALGLALFGVACARLLPPVAMLAARRRPAREA